jgi:hypothetical protein
MVWQIPDAVDTVVCAPDDGWKYHPKHVEQFPDINKLFNVASSWIYTYIGILLGAHPVLHISRIKVKVLGIKAVRFFFMLIYLWIWCILFKKNCYLGDCEVDVRGSVYHISNFAVKNPTTARPTTFHICKTRSRLCSFRLLMLGGVSPETYWVLFKIRNNQILIHCCILLDFSL